MTDTEAAVFILAGLASVVHGFTGKQFYAAKGRWNRGRQIPNWAGRLMFFFVGSLFLFVGIVHVVHNS
jgi:hypothetical protein